nr:pre-mRNA splicing Prp18-interacting factor [Tanacetum cinerariifolium]
MSTFVLCVGCGEPLYGFSPCRWCTCERCGIDMLNGICLLCHLSNSCAYDHNQNTLDCLPDPYHPPHPTYETNSGDTCGNDSHFGYDCPPQFPFNYKPEPRYIQNYNSYPHDSSLFPQQYPCCEDCGVTHEPYQCQPMNHDYYCKQNFCYDSNSIGFDQSQTQQYIVTHPIFSAHHDLLGSQTKLKFTLTKVNEQMTQLTSMCELACQLVQKNLEEKQLEEAQTVKAQSWKLPVCYDDDDDGEGFNSLQDNINSELPLCSAITPNEPIDSLSIEDEHLNTIPATESDEFIKSCVENLVPNPSKSKGESECNVLAGFTTFSNVLFDYDYDFDSSDDQSLSVEDVQEKIYSNPLFDEEIIPMEIDPYSFNAESDLIESLPNHDSSVIISSKIDSLFNEFADELTLLKSFLLGIDETDCHPKKEIRFAKRLLYDNSSPRPPEEIVSDNSNADIESFSPSPIPIKDCNSHMEEIDLYFNSDDPVLPGIEDDDYDSERDILILEELLDNYSFSLPANESYHFDIPLPYRPPTKPPDGNIGTLNIKMMGDVSDQKVPIPNVTITRILNQEKSPDLLSHLGFEAFQPSAECPMIINGKNTHVLDVLLFHFYPLDQFKYGGIRSSSAT